MSILVDIILAVLLIMAIGYGMSLNRKIVALRRDQGELEKLAASFYDATKRAETSVANLRHAAAESSRLLNEGVDEAGGVCDDLKYLIGRGEAMADKLESGVRIAEREIGNSSDDEADLVVEVAPERQDVDLSEAETLGRALGERVLNEQSTSPVSNGLLSESGSRNASSEGMAKTDAERELIKALQAVR